MSESLFNLILQTATYNGEACYNSMEELEKTCRKARKDGFPLSP